MFYTFDFDVGTGIVRVKATGYWTVSLGRSYCDEMERHIAEARRTAGSLRLLIDFMEMGLQPAEVNVEIGERHKLMDFRPSDRVAICAPPGFNRSNSERSEAIAEVSFFSSPGAARSWLLDRRAFATAA